MEFWGLVHVDMACLTVRMGPHARIANNELYKSTFESALSLLGFLRIVRLSAGVPVPALLTWFVY